MKRIKAFKQPWINSAFSDSVFILMPPFLALFIVALFPQQFKESEEMPLIYWLVLIVFIDVAHVYSTLYRTYFNPSEYKEKQSLLISIPVLCYVTGVIFYTIDAFLFWRILAYLAVFHFIRQQYGFMRLYSRLEYKTRLYSLINSLTIYSSTLYPLLYWHLNPHRNFNWLIEGDFWQYKSQFLSDMGLVMYLAVLGMYLLKEAYLYHISKEVNIPRNLLVLGTALSWFFGIVYFNGDLAFTTLNVISHGIPYMALIWFFEKNKIQNNQKMTSSFLKVSFGKYDIVIFILILSVFAYFEEGLWDGLIWKEHSTIFRPFAFLPQIEEKKLLSLLVPLLALPQATHYVLDAFIWGRRNTKSITN
ncbi:hypothetical protein WG906_00970 [Pedobacter sp. P351]|uniref:hypothetical protein n=1 Tax=Pedobacter superstes TaxID=3133441 RepID=UPI0030956646